MKLIRLTRKLGTQNVPTNVNGPKFATICHFLIMWEMDQRTENVTKEKHNRNIQLLRKKRFGGMLSGKEKHIVNLSDYSLSDTEKLVSSNGLELCPPPKRCFISLL